MTKTPTRSAGRPTRQQAARLDEQVRLAAVQAFIARGFDGVTMEEVARAAGIGKPALYARYADKRELFTTVIPWALQNLNWLDPLEGATGAGLEAALQAIARAAHERAIDPETVGLVRMVMAEAPRFTEIALTSDELIRSPLITSVIDVLAAHTDQLAIDDLQTAAEQFIGLVHLMPLTFAAFGFRRDGADAEAHLTAVVHTFLRGVLAR